MASKGTVQRTGARPASGNGRAIPHEIDETIEHRLAELRPLHDEYTQLLSYRRLVGETISATDVETPLDRSTRATPGAARAEILAALAEGPKTSAEPTLELSVTPATLRYNLRRLTRTGVIVESGHEDAPTYTLASEERERT